MRIMGQRFAGRQGSAGAGAAGEAQARLTRWHAARFAMQRKWGRVLAMHCSSRGASSVRRAEVCVHELSRYTDAVMVSGARAAVLRLLRRCCAPDAPAVSDKRVLRGQREAIAMLYDPKEKFPFGGIGPARVVWRRGVTDDLAEVALWVHCACADSTIPMLHEAADMEADVCVQTAAYLSRLALRGPAVANLLCRFFGLDTSTDAGRGAVHEVQLSDPRQSAAKRTSEASVSTAILWAAGENLKPPCPTDTEVNTRRFEARKRAVSLVPSEVDHGTAVASCQLIHQTGGGGRTSGWDVVLRSEWCFTIFLAIVHSGAFAVRDAASCGSTSMKADTAPCRSASRSSRFSKHTPVFLCESYAMRFHRSPKTHSLTGRFPRDYPDTPAGVVEGEAARQRKEHVFDALPPQQRPNFVVQRCPPECRFGPCWDLLCKEADVSYPCVVVRGRRFLEAFQSADGVATAAPKTLLYGRVTPVAKGIASPGMMVRNVATDCWCPANARAGFRSVSEGCCRY